MLPFLQSIDMYGTDFFCAILLVVVISGGRVGKASKSGPGFLTCYGINLLFYASILPKNASFTEKSGLELVLDCVIMFNFCF